MTSETDPLGNIKYFGYNKNSEIVSVTGRRENILNNDHGNYVYATYTGHVFDTTLDIYFAEARFYDANTRTWLAMDPIKDGGNWYQYCYSNPLKYWDPLGLAPYDPGQPWANRNQPYASASSRGGFQPYGGCDNAMPWTLKTRDQTIEILAYQLSMERLRNNPVYQSITEIVGGIGKIAAGVTLVIGVVGGSAAIAPALGVIFVVSGSATAIFGANEVASGLADINQILNGEKVKNNNYLLNHVFEGDEQKYQAWDMLFGTITASGHLTLAYQKYFPDTIKGGIPSGYYQDATGRWHRPNGRFASNAEVGITSSAKVSSGSHGNSLADTRISYGYALVDRDTNEILKFGETLHPDTRYSQNYLDSNNAKMMIIEEGSKLDIHLWQHDMNEYYFYKYHKYPPMNNGGW